MTETYIKDKAASWGAVSGATGSANIPPGTYDRIELIIPYTVTDASISAGETLDGAVVELRLGGATHPLIHLGRDMLALAVDLLRKGVSTGLVNDSLPTSATENRAHFIFYGPWVIEDEEDGQLNLTLNPAQEWATASAFTASMTVKAYAFDESKDAYARRIGHAMTDSGTTPKCRVPMGLDPDAMLVLAGTAGVLTQFNAPPGIVEPYANASHATYSAYKTTALVASPLRYLYGPIYDEVDDEIVFQASSATTLTILFAEGVGPSIGA